MSDPDPARPADPNHRRSAARRRRRPAAATIPAFAAPRQPTDGVPISVGDPVTRKSRLLARQCDTCIFRPGNPMHLADGRLRDLVREATGRESFVICHDTLPHGPHPDTAPAICRGFYDRYHTTALQIIDRLFGFIECDPPPAT